MSSCWLGAGSDPGVAGAAGGADQAQGRGRGERQEPAEGPGRPGARRLVTVQYSTLQCRRVQYIIPIIVFKLNAA